MDIRLSGFQNVNFQNTNFKRQAFTMPLAMDTVNFKGNIYRYADDDETLFDDCVLRKMNGFDDIKPENLSLIHITNYFPNNGRILSLKNASKDHDGIGQSRSTVHFSLNQSVEKDNTQIDWASMNYAIIMPFKNAMDVNPKEKMIGGKYKDFFFVDEVKLPKGTKIVKYNKNIQKGQFRISDAKDENGTLLNGIELIETSDKDICAVAQRVSNKMGYSSFDDLFYSTPELKKDAARLKEIINSGDFSKMEPGSEEFYEFLKLSGKVNSEKFESMELLDDAWGDFCSNAGFADLEQGYNNPWTKSDLLIHFIENILVDSNNNSWFYDNDGKIIDFRDEISSQIDKIKEMKPSNKDLGFDVEMLKQIVAESDTPSLAAKNIGQKLKLKAITMPDKILEDNPYKYFNVAIAANSAEDITPFLNFG